MKRLCESATAVLKGSNVNDFPVLKTRRTAQHGKMKHEPSRENIIEGIKMPIFVYN